MIDENGTIHVRNSHGGATVSFRPRLPQGLKAGKRMAVNSAATLRGEGRINQWVRATKPGARIIYHIGVLAQDREADGSGVIERTAQAALQCYREGYVLLVQIPVTREDGKRGIGYNYVAVRTDKKFEENFREYPKAAA